MTESLEEYKAVVCRLYEALNRRQWDALDELLAPGYVHHGGLGHDMTLEELRQIMLATVVGWSRTPPEVGREGREVRAQGKLLQMLELSHDRWMVGVNTGGSYARLSHDSLGCEQRPTRTVS